MNMYVIFAKNQMQQKISWYLGMFEGTVEFFNRIVIGSNSCERDIHTLTRLSTLL